jgi:uncharacterized protein
LQAQAQALPRLTGRVVDEANLLGPAQEAALVAKLQALEERSSRQLVVATVQSLGGYPIEDYGNRLFRTWQIGQAKANNGALFLIAPNERKVRIEVGYGLEPILTDAFTGLLIQNKVVPAFRNGDFAGGIVTGADALIEQLQAPPEVAERRVLEARQIQAQRQARRSSAGDGGSIMPLLFWGAVFLFIVLPMLRGRRGGRRYRRGGGGFPVILWGRVWAAASAAVVGSAEADLAGEAGLAAAFPAAAAPRAAAELRDRGEPHPGPIASGSAAPWQRQSVRAAARSSPSSPTIRCLP